MILTKLSKLAIYTLTFLLVLSCGQSKPDQTVSSIADTSKNIKTDQQKLKSEHNLDTFLPKGYVIFEKINGDLNNDGIDDCVLIIKGTDKKQIVKDEYRGELDRNRRGIIILFKEGEQFKVVLQNNDCFSSENEDGGVYYAPELSVEIENRKLIVHYSHGRYGYWRYIFRFNNTDYELIGYDSSNGAPVTDSETSVNFLTRKKQEKININENAEGGDEVFKETWTKINILKLIKLSEIEDFDNLDMSVY